MAPGNFCVIATPAYTTAQRGFALHVLKVRWQSLQEQRRTSQGGGTILEVIASAL